VGRGRGPGGQRQTLHTGDVLGARALLNEA
jgi:hypothetical protein